MHMQVLVHSCSTNTTGIGRIWWYINNSAHVLLGTMSDSDSDYVSDASDADTVILSDSEPEEEPEPLPQGIPRLVRQDAIILRRPLIMVRREKGG